MLKVLIVEDEPISRKATRKMLSTLAGVMIMGEAASGEEAIQMIPSLLPHLVIADIFMPGITGLKLGEWILTNFPEIKLIYLTGHRDFNLIQKSMKLNAVDFILKPTKMEDLWEAISRAKKKCFGDDPIHDSGMFRVEGNTLVVNQQIAKSYGHCLPDEIPCNKLVRQAVEYINSQYHQDITLKHMGEVLFLNETYFCDVFKTETGISFVRYLTIVRIEKAKQLLAGKFDLKLYQISSMIGYKNPKYFSQVFKKLVGIPPVEYQNNSGL